MNFYSSNFVGWDILNGSPRLTLPEQNAKFPIFYFWITTPRGLLAFTHLSKFELWKLCERLVSFQRCNYYENMIWLTLHVYNIQNRYTFFLNIFLNEEWKLFHLLRDLSYISAKEVSGLQALPIECRYFLLGYLSIIFIRWQIPADWSAPIHRSFLPFYLDILQDQTRPTKWRLLNVLYHWFDHVHGVMLIAKPCCDIIFRL